MQYFLCAPFFVRDNRNSRSRKYERFDKYLFVPPLLLLMILENVSPPTKNQRGNVFEKLVKNIANIGKHSKNVNGPILATETDPRGRFLLISKNFERLKSFEIFDTVSNVNQNI